MAGESGLGEGRARTEAEVLRWFALASPLLLPTPAPPIQPILQALISQVLVTAKTLG